MAHRRHRPLRTRRLRSWTTAPALPPARPGSRSSSSPPTAPPSVLAAATARCGHDAPPATTAEPSSSTPTMTSSSKHAAPGATATSPHDYRRWRPMVERSLAWLVRPGRRVAYRGTARNRIWLAHRTAAINLQRLINLGLTHHQHLATRHLTARPTKQPSRPSTGFNPTSRNRTQPQHRHIGFGHSPRPTTTRPAATPLLSTQHREDRHPQAHRDDAAGPDRPPRASCSPSRSACTASWPSMRWWARRWPTSRSPPSTVCRADTPRGLAWPCSSRGASACTTWARGSP